MHGAEIELKFAVEDPGAFRRLVGGLGFELETERTFEQNTLYDTAERSLRERGQILRLRTYGPRCVLTHKRPPDVAGDASRYKTRIETETTVDDCSALAEVFQQIGYMPVFVYEKFRTEWLGDDGVGHLVLDETPIGIWAELEGPIAWIDAMLERLGVGPDESITLSYGKLFLQWKERTHSDVEHMTFAAIEEPVAR